MIMNMKKIEVAILGPSEIKRDTVIVIELLTTNKIYFKMYNIVIKMYICPVSRTCIGLIMSNDHLIALLSH